MTPQQHFLSLHDGKFIMPNPWDVGSARILASLGFEALATTSAGYANSRGRHDGRITREEAIAHSKEIVQATPLPVNADLENGFGDAPDDVVETIRQAIGVGLAGCSIEDYSGDVLYPIEAAKERIQAGVEANHASTTPLVLTARAENHIRGNPDLADTIKRLQAYQEAGADVLYAPGVVRVDDIRTLTQSVDRPVNCLIMPGGPGATEMLDAGATRISTGSALAAHAHAALIDGAKELLDQGTHEFWNRAVTRMGAIASAMKAD